MLLTLDLAFVSGISACCASEGSSCFLSALLSGSQAAAPAFRSEHRWQEKRGKKEEIEAEWKCKSLVSSRLFSPQKKKKKGVVCLPGDGLAVKSLPGSGCSTGQGLEVKPALTRRKGESWVQDHRALLVLVWEPGQLVLLALSSSCLASSGVKCKASPMGMVFPMGAGWMISSSLANVLLLWLITKYLMRTLPNAFASACEEGMETEGTVLLALTKCLRCVEALPPVQAINCKGLALFSGLIHC